jgi:ribonuclease P protein component
MTQKFTLKAEERLKSKKDIENLFEVGRSYFKFPFKLIFIKQENTDGNVPIKFSISVPKKKIKTAVDRNLIKRRTREAYRLNKHNLQENLIQHGYKVSLMFIYLENDVKKFAVIEKSIKKHLDELFKMLCT